MPSIARGIIACICQDMKPEQEDLEGIIAIEDSPPFIKFQPDQCAVV